MSIVVCVSGRISVETAELTMWDITDPSGVMTTIKVNEGISCSGFHKVFGMYSSIVMA